jgi:hypothetical protein
MMSHTRNMDYDGGKVNGTNVTVNFAKEFNKIMHTRLQ